MCICAVRVCIQKDRLYIWEKLFQGWKRGKVQIKRRRKKGASKTNKNEQKRKREKPTETEKKKESYSYLRRDFFLRGGCVRVCKCVREWVCEIVCMYVCIFALVRIWWTIYKRGWECVFVCVRVWVKGWQVEKDRESDKEIGCDSMRIDKKTAFSLHVAKQVESSSDTQLGCRLRIAYSRYIDVSVTAFKFINHGQERWGRMLLL